MYLKCLINFHNNIHSTLDRNVRRFTFLYNMYEFIDDIKVYLGFKSRM